jgi:hypothetical protein
MLPQRIKISERALYQQIENEMVILDLAKEQYYGLDDVGARMWQLIVQHEDTATVLKELGSYYDVDEAVLSKDLSDLIAKLINAGLLTVCTEHNINRAASA